MLRLCLLGREWSEAPIRRACWSLHYASQVHGQSGYDHQSGSLRSAMRQSQRKMSISFFFLSMSPAFTKKAGMWKKLLPTFLLSKILSQHFSLYWWGKGKHEIRCEVDALKQTQRSLANQPETILITKDDQQIVQADWDIMKESSSQRATGILLRTVGGNSWKR